MENDGFVLVSKRKAAKSRKLKNYKISVQVDDDIDIEALCK